MFAYLGIFLCICLFGASSLFYLIMLTANNPHITHSTYRIMSCYTSVANIGFIFSHIPDGMRISVNPADVSGKIYSTLTLPFCVRNS